MESETTLEAVAPVAEDAEAASKTAATKGKAAGMMERGQSQPSSSNSFSSLLP